MPAMEKNSRPAVLVTGGAKRIGAAISRAFGTAGWHVVIHYGRSADAAEALAAELAAICSKVQVSLLAPGPVKSAIMDEPAPPQTAGFMAMLRGMSDENGMSPDELAALVFEAIGRGDYWIIPHPEMLDEPLRDRTRMIIDRSSPTSFGLVATNTESMGQHDGK